MYIYLPPPLQLFPQWQQNWTSSNDASPPLEDFESWSHNPKEKTITQKINFQADSIKLIFRKFYQVIQKQNEAKPFSAVQTADLPLLSLFCTVLLNPVVCKRVNRN